MTSLSIFAHELHEKLSNTRHVVLIAHKLPDGDAIGSLEWFRQLLEDNYASLQISVVIPPEKIVDTHITWVLWDIESSIPDTVDLVIILDTSVWSRTALDLVPQPLSILSIDHHESQTDSIDGFRDASAPSNTVILTDLARELGWTISPHAATALLLGIYTDTGGFIHRNSSQRAFETAGFLLSQWADQSRIAIDTFGNYTLDYLHDLGRWLLEIVQEWPIACLFFTETPDNSHLKSHIIGYLSGLTGVDVACVLLQRDGIVKWSFRTRKDGIDVNELAQKFGGGGHKKAAGFTLIWNLTGNRLNWQETSWSPKDFIAHIQSLIN